MKKICVIAAAVIGLALAAPVSAHDNCVADCPDEIGDKMDLHEAAIDALGDMGGLMGGDPADDNIVDTATQTMADNATQRGQAASR